LIHGDFPAECVFSCAGSRVSRPIRHSVGQFRDDLPRQSLDWCKKIGSSNPNQSPGYTIAKQNNYRVTQKKPKQQ